MTQQTAIPAGPVELRSLAELDAFTKQGPRMSDEPCGCGEPRQRGHKYCGSCASQQARKLKTQRQRRWRNRRKTPASPDEG